MLDQIEGVLSRVIPLQPTGGDNGKIIVELVRHFDVEERGNLIEHVPTGGDKGEFPNG